MTSPTRVAEFHAAYDRHTDDHVRLFKALLDMAAPDACVLYPGSYIDIAASVWFHNVTYVDTDKRAARFFGCGDKVAALIVAKRHRVNNTAGPAPQVTFVHTDYRCDLPVSPGSVDVVMSLYGGFISESCSQYLTPGGVLIANDSHGDASLASLDPSMTLVAVVETGRGSYRCSSSELATYLQPKHGERPTAAALHQSGRGVAYTRSPALYVFERGAAEPALGQPAA